MKTNEYKKKLLYRWGLLKLAGGATLDEVYGTLEELKKKGVGPLKALVKKESR